MFAGDDRSGGEPGVTSAPVRSRASPRRRAIRLQSLEAGVSLHQYRSTNCATRKLPRQCPSASPASSSRRWRRRGWRNTGQRLDRQQTMTSCWKSSGRRYSLPDNDVRAASTSAASPGRPAISSNRPPLSRWPGILRRPFLASEALTSQRTSGTGRDLRRPGPPGIRMPGANKPGDAAWPGKVARSRSTGPACCAVEGEGWCSRQGQSDRDQHPILGLDPHRSEAQL